MRSVFRVIRFAFQDVFRNMSLSLMTILILVLMLLSMNTLLIVRLLTGEAVASIKDQIDVSIYFHHTAPDDAVSEVQSFLLGFPEVVDITHRSKEDVLEEFRAAHAGSKDILAAIDEVGENPFGPTLILRTREPGDYEAILTALNIPEYESLIEEKTFGETERAIERIDIITRQVEYFVAALSGLFAIIAFIVIFNTIRVAIYTQRAEISIKKLVGATNWFVRGPYVVEALIFSFVSVAVALGILIGVADLLDPYIGIVFEQPGILTNYVSSHILMLAAVQFGMVLILTVITSGLAMRRYLRT